MDSEYLTASSLKSLYDLDFKRWCWLLHDTKKDKRTNRGFKLYCIKEIKEKYSRMPEDKFFDRFTSKHDFKKDYGNKRLARLRSILCTKPNLFIYCSFGYGGRGGKFYLKSLLEAITDSSDYRKRLSHKKVFLDKIIEVKGVVSNIINDTDFIFKSNTPIMLKNEEGKEKEAIYFDCRLKVIVEDMKGIKGISGSFAKNTLNNVGYLKIFYVVKIIE